MPQNLTQTRPIGRSLFKSLSPNQHDEDGGIWQLNGSEYQPAIPLGKRFWALTTEEREALNEIFESEIVRPALAALRGGTKDDSMELVDAAYWMKGCSSLGRLRYACLLRIGKGKVSGASVSLM